MDKNDWKSSLELLNKLLAQKGEELIKINKDIEEISYTIGCYEKKIKTLPDVPEPPKEETIGKLVG
jgi:hypothetical protein